MVMELVLLLYCLKLLGEQLPPMPYSTSLGPADSMQGLNYENGKSQQKHATGLWRKEKVHWDM